MQNFEILNVLEDLLISVQKEKLHPGEDTHVKHLIYLVEDELERIKKKHQLPSYNAKIFSERIAKSFFWVDRDIFSNEDKESGRAISPMDYQYWLMVFLLTHYNELYKGGYSLFEIVDQFVEYHKLHSLTAADIFITDTGATRCKTNLRFAISSLKEMGLVKLYDKDEKEKSWMLTYPGFFTAASICIDHDKRRLNPLSGSIPDFHVSRYFKIDQWLLERMIKLGDPDYFGEILKFVAQDVLEFKELQKGSEIFKEYCDFLQNLTIRKAEQPKQTHETEEISEFLWQLEAINALNDYMTELSDKFNSDAFVARLLKGKN